MLLLLPTTTWAQHNHQVTTDPSKPTPAVAPHGTMLADETVTALRKGEGMGVAKVAELNHYPGPRHVLDLAEKLMLTADQKLQLEAVFARMQTKAQALGEAILAAEAQLNTLFATGKADETQVDAQTRTIALLQGELRATHLRAHLDAKRILTPEQVTLYDAARGYQNGMPKTTTTMEPETEQVVKIRVTDAGYVPDQVEVWAGKPVTMLFKQESKNFCNRQVQIPAFHVLPVTLPFGEETAIRFTPDQSGTFLFTCGMKMTQGTLMVKKR